MLASSLGFQGKILFHDPVIGMFLVCMVALIKQQESDITQVYSFFFILVVQSVDKYLRSHNNDLVALKEILERDFCCVGAGNFTHRVLVSKEGLKSLLLLENKVQRADDKDHSWFFSSVVACCCFNN